MSQGIRNAKPDSAHHHLPIEACMHAMNAIRIALHDGDVNRLDRAMVAFHEAFAPTRQYIENSEIRPITTEEKDQLRLLAKLHHKAMRSIMGKMHNIQEDIRVIEGASMQLHHVSQLAGNS